jgi:hypothetical protein|mmetsp:Transcript_80571/g.215090  ORF Transcript_80571/g.215090 Transcript_80571/m.215090 type:complete len:92 (-) Transcript_80571:84-359(-)
MTKLLCLIVALLLAVSSVSSFVVYPAKSPSLVRSTTTGTTKSCPSMALQLVDPSSTLMVAEASQNAIGSIFMFVGIVSLWELYTPGRAKKE